MQRERKSVNKVLPVLILTVLFVTYQAIAVTPPALEKYPYPGYSDLAQKAQWLQQDLRRDNLQYGLVMPRVLLPPAGNADHSSAHQEDGGNRSGPYLAALSFQYAVTQDDKVQKWADETFAAIEILEKVTGVPGCLARSFNLSDKPQRHEQWFFFPGEWHQSTSMPGYRWLGDPSSDTMTNLLYGLSVYYDLAADQEHKQRVRTLVDRVVTREMNEGMRIVDVDGKMTLWGNYNPHLAHETLNSLLPLGHLKIAYHITGAERFQFKYMQLIEKYGYADQAILANSFKPPSVPWDTKLGMEALYHLLSYEDNLSLRDKYLASLERYWMTQKKRNFVAFQVTYNHFVPDNHGFSKKSIEALVNWNGAWRQHRDEWLRQEGGPMHVVGTWQEPAQEFLRAYWSARYYKLLTADNKPGPGNPPDWARPTKDKYAGMVFVPGGKFIMGSNIGDADEYPQRFVDVKPFYIDRFEVSNKEYASFKANHKYWPEKANEPVLNVNWYDAVAYAKWAGKRLPTEAEWEKAARGTDGRKYPWGNIHDMSFAEPDGVVQEAAWRAGKSPYGAYWMAGGAWEWTADWYRPYPGNTTFSPAYGEKYKVIRGASRFADPSMQRCAHRYYLDPTTHVSGYPVGFRCVKDAE